MAFACIDHGLHRERHTALQLEARARLGDLDPQGHVNNTVFSTYFETGRVAIIHHPREGLQAEGAAAPLVLWAIAEEVRAMARVKTAMAGGQPQQQALRDAKVWGSRQDLMPAALRRLTHSQLVAALRRAAEIDRMIKGLGSGDVWDALLQLGLELTTPAPQGRATANRGKIGANIRG